MILFLTLVYQCALLLVVSPLLLGIIARTKARFAGRVGPPLLQPYWDLLRLLGKGAVYSRTTTWLFRAGPMVSLAALFTAGLLVPFGGLQAPLGFSGDLLLFIGLLALSRFATVLAALDTGSSFEGMGASREVTFAALAEPTLAVSLLVLAKGAGHLSLSGILGASLVQAWAEAGPALALVAAGLGICFLTENCRMPVDDPTTHLELTMIHEVMVLDHSGPDFAFILHGAAMKLMVLGAVLVRLVLPVEGVPAGQAAFLTGLVVLAVAVGVLESALARLRLLFIPQFLVAAAVLAAFGVVIVLR
ncbi:MAG: NADH-quinone oxidoreductase subunit H [Planctomycetes bacterium]|nr:NADH-quinone oxidoreductase subunit H [Planctomycetota bacterium]